MSYIAPYYTEPVRLLYGSSAVLQRFFGMTDELYSTVTIQNLLSSCMVLQRFFGMTDELYSTVTIQNLLSSCMVLQRFFGMTDQLYSTATIQNLLIPFKGSFQAKEPLLVLFSTIYVEKIQCNMAPLLVLHSTI